MTKTPNTKPDVTRVVGLDCHPDSFTAAILRGPIPAVAITEKIFHQIPLAQLQRWAEKHTVSEDVLLLEASGNSFHLARLLQASGRQVKVLESYQLSKLKEVHANNDKISAVRIAKAYLAGTAKEVWIPDLKTQERRDWFLTYQKTIKTSTQTSNRITSYLSDHGVRLPQGHLDPCTPAKKAALRQERSWTSREWQVLEMMLEDLQHAQQARARWSSLLAQEVLADKTLLSLVRLCGIRHVVAFALGAIIGDIRRFATPKKLVKYIGLHPAFDDSGKNHWSGGIGGHGRGDLRSLLIQSAHAILRAKTPLTKWAKKLLGRKGEVKLVVAAVARKLAVAVWYLLMGHWTEVQEVDAQLAAKINKIIRHVGSEVLAEQKTTTGDLRTKAHESLQHGRIYVLRPYQPSSPTKSKGKKPEEASMKTERNVTPEAKPTKGVTEAADAARPGSCRCSGTNPAKPKGKKKLVPSGA